MLLFTYFGDSKFTLEVYDSLCYDHFREDDGVLTFDDFVSLLEGCEFIDLSSVSGTLISGNSNISII